MTYAVVSMDFETRSGTDIALGYCRYFGDPEAAILCLAWSRDGEDPQLWTPGAPDPEPLLAHVRAGKPIRGWNVLFEFHAWNTLAPRHWPRLTLAQCLDTMAQAAVANMPQALGECAKALGLPQDQQKDKRGKYLIQRLCKPHPPTKTRAGHWVEDPALLDELYAYCVQDVRVEMALADALPTFTKAHQARWLLTQTINARGVPVDRDEISRIVSVVEQEKHHLNAKLKAISNIASASRRDELLTWVRGQGVDLPDLTGDTVSQALRDLPDSPARQALAIRSQVCQTSTAKYEKMLEIVCPDGTIKGLLTYHGASTGRFASRGGLNAQNLPRNPIKDTDTCVTALSMGDWRLASAIYGDEVMDAAVSAVRAVIKAPPGYEFIDADFSSVENRCASWIAGQTDKVEAFAQGLDEYKLFAADMYGVAYDTVDSKMRQVAKSAVLGCFGAGTRVLTERGFVQIVDVRSTDRLWDGQAWVHHHGVADQGVKPVIDLAGVAVTPEHQILQGDETWERADTLDLHRAITLASGRLPDTAPTGANSEKAKPRSKLSPSKPVAEVRTYDILNAGPRHRFTILTDVGPLIVHNCMFGQGWQGLIMYAKTYNVTLDEEKSRELVNRYRLMYANVQALWYACGDAALEAVETPGKIVKVNPKLTMQCLGGFLTLKLPSGRVLYWYEPKIETLDTPWGQKRNGVTVMGVNQVTRKFTRQKLIGSSIFQSAVQATAADLLIHAVQNVEQAGYPVVLLVHDEILAQVPTGFGDVAEFGRRMCTPPVWAKDLPLAFEGWRGPRFRK